MGKKDFRKESRDNKYEAKVTSRKEETKIEDNREDQKIKVYIKRFTDYPFIMKELGYAPKMLQPYEIMAKTIRKEIEVGNAIFLFGGDTINPLKAGDLSCYLSPVPVKELERTTDKVVANPYKESVIPVVPNNETSEEKDTSEEDKEEELSGEDQ